MNAQNISPCMTIVVIMEICMVVMDLIVVTVEVTVMVTIPLVAMAVTCDHPHELLHGSWLLLRAAQPPRLSMGTPPSGVASAPCLAGPPSTPPRCMVKAYPAQTPALTLQQTFGESLGV